MNPYDFVRIDWNNPPKKRRPLFWDRFRGLAGRIEGRITAETPLLIRCGDARGSNNVSMKNNENKHREGSFVHNSDGKEIIPGSALKGLIRSVVEMVGNGCWHHFTGRYRKYPERRDRNEMLNLSSHLPEAFRPCSDKNALCIACRLFGFAGGNNNSLAGAVSFSDAICVHPVPFASGFLPPLMPPKPRHAAFYTPDGRRLAGRKLYFHQNRVQMVPHDRRGTGRRVQPLGPGSQFEFSIDFSHVDEQDWPVLVYALVLEKGVRHKLGYGKPVGLGSVRIELTRIELVDFLARYRSGNEKKVYEGERLEEYVSSVIAPFVNDRDNVTLNDLRRIWAWPPAPLQYAYPTREWFNRNPQAPIKATGG